MADQEAFSWKKWFAGLWGLVNYAKVASILAKVIIIAFAVFSAMNVVDRILPKKQVQQQQQQISANPTTGGKTEITNVYNNNKEKNWILGTYGDYAPKDNDFRLGGFVARMF